MKRSWTWRTQKRIYYAGFCGFCGLSFLKSEKGECPWLVAEIRLLIFQIDIFKNNKSTEYGKS